MVAHNVVTGELVLTGPNELAEDMPVLDVRTVGEYAARYIPNSLNIPYTQLRAWLGDRAEAVLVMGGGLSLRILAMKTTPRRSARQ